MDIRNLIDGYQIMISPHMILGYKPKRPHHKRRINKKWEKRYGYSPIYDMEHVYMHGNYLIMSQGYYDKLKAAIKETRWSNASRFKLVL